MNQTNLPPENQDPLYTPTSYSEILHQAELPGPKQAFYLFAFCLIFVAMIGSLLQIWHRQIGLILTEILYIFLPTLVYAKSLRLNFRKTFRLTPINFKTACITVLMTGAAFILIAQFAILQEKFIPTPPEYARFLEEFLLNFKGLSLIWGVLLLAVLPGICEEMLFRGFILSGFLKGFHRETAVILTGILFGIIHLDIYRFIPTSLLGILFGYLVLKTGSILTAMLAHTTNNSIILFLAQITPPEEVHMAVGEPKQIPVLLLLTAGITLVLSFRAIERTKPV
ncbi:MAG TPA: type II CAAX endopeptidase family protein [Candidatus Limnocylindrales bacterium]|nr:type II CAAX endopeptidase family protein [Candidatus Limnocylindrales bacterium]